MNNEQFGLQVLENMPEGFRMQAKRMRDHRERIVRNTRDPKALLRKMHQWQSQFLSMREILENVVYLEGIEQMRLGKIAVQALDEILHETATTIGAIRRAHSNNSTKTNHQKDLKQ
jgi:hypothetical protein